MPLILMLTTALLMIMAALHLATPIIYGTNTETIGVGVFGLTYLILGLLMLSGTEYVPVSTLVITAMGTFGAVKSYHQNVEIQRMTRAFVRLGAVIIVLLVLFFVFRFV